MTTTAPKTVVKAGPQTEKTWDAAAYLALSLVFLPVALGGVVIARELTKDKQPDVAAEVRRAPTPAPTASKPHR